MDHFGSFWHVFHCFSRILAAFEHLEAERQELESISRARVRSGTMINLEFQQDEDPEKVKVFGTVEGGRTLDPFTVAIADSGAIEKLG